MKINSKGNKILIFSDVHQEVDKLAKIIKHEAADINICLGDWFDSHFIDKDEDVQKTAFFLKDYLAGGNVTLFGNHDLHYFFANKYTTCSGYEHRKSQVIDKTFGEDKLAIIDKFSWFLFLDEFLCTHAGLHYDFLSPIVLNSEDLYEYLTIQGNDANIKIRTKQFHWFYGAGYSRCGDQPKGGIVWLDFDREFAPLKIMPQIFGHTYRRKGKIQTHCKTENYCIDTNLNEWMTITNGKLEIKNYKNL
ncbi:MAG: metallophosphoesterase [Chryseobacterium taeanense]